MLPLGDKGKVPRRLGTEIAKCLVLHGAASPPPQQ